MNRSFTRLLIALLCLALAPSLSGADEIRVAAASNFRDAISDLARRFEAQTQHQVTLIFGSTGKQYAQILHGAPFDVFFAADAERPELLEQAGQAIPDSRFAYALGKLALWSPKADFVLPGGAVLTQGAFRYLAIANPDLAPYGKAARETLESLEAWDALSGQIVRGENIAQAFQFVKSGNAELGFVAWSQLQAETPLDGSYWLVPQQLHAPIEQQAVLLRENEAARAFLSFMRSEQAMTVIRAHGYDIP
jgi:molybdate transport system substrate-binding protein